MWLKKDKGGAAIGPHEWPEDGSVTEVPDDLGRSLLAIPDGGYEQVTGPPEPDRFARTEDGKVVNPDPGENASPDVPAPANDENDDPAPEPVADASPADPEPVTPAKRGPKAKA